MKVIFLDFEGVLITPRVHCALGQTGIMRRMDPVAIGMINQLVGEDKDTTQIVISSTHRIRYSCEELLQQLRDAGFTGKIHEDWATKRDAAGFRGAEVAEWLSRHKEVTHYICLDDSSDFYPDQALVRVDTYNGISVQNFWCAEDILNGPPNAPHLAPKPVKPRIRLKAKKITP